MYKFLQSSCLSTRCAVAYDLKLKATYTCTRTHTGPGMRQSAMERQGFPKVLPTLTAPELRNSISSLTNVSNFPSHQPQHLQQQHHPHPSQQHQHQHPLQQHQHQHLIQHPQHQHHSQHHQHTLDSGRGTLGSNKTDWRSESATEGRVL